MATWAKTRTNIRRFGSRRRRASGLPVATRSYVGWVTDPKAGGAIPFRSEIERDWLIHLFFDPAVASIARNDLSEMERTKRAGLAAIVEKYRGEQLERDRPMPPFKAELDRDPEFARRVHLFTRAREVGVRRACDELGFQNTWYYRWKPRVERGGFSVLRTVQHYESAARSESVA